MRPDPVKCSVMFWAFCSIETFRQKCVQAADTKSVARLRQRCRPLDAIIQFRTENDERQAIVKRLFSSCPGETWKSPPNSFDERFRRLRFLISQSHGASKLLPRALPTWGADFSHSAAPLPRTPSASPSYSPQNTWRASLIKAHYSQIIIGSEICLASLSLSEREE